MLKTGPVVGKLWDMPIWLKHLQFTNQFLASTTKYQLSYI